MGRLILSITVPGCAACGWASPPEYVYEGAWGSFGTNDGEFDHPGGIALAANGRVYVADGSNHRVQYFTSTGSFLGKWGSRGSADGQFAYIGGLAFGPNGYLYVADLDNHRVQYFTADGSFLGKWGTRGSGPGEFYYPVGVAVAPNGDVYVTEEGNCRVQYFRWSAPAVSPTSLGRVKALFR
jgi:tripartite motif-containing protein 71